jgi:hypothetical protein
LSNVYEVRSSANAFALWVAPDQLPSSLDWVNSEDLYITKWVVSAANDKEIFIGWTKEVNGSNYISSIAFETPPYWSWPVGPYYAEIDIPSTHIFGEGAPSKPPDEEVFWLKSDHSQNSATIVWDPVWDPNTGRKMLIVMNLDGSSNIEADIQLGIRVPIFIWLPYLLIPLGATFIAVGTILIKRRRKY